MQAQDGDYAAMAFVKSGMCLCMYVFVCVCVCMFVFYLLEQVDLLRKLLEHDPAMLMRE